ncbi:uncharacterized protein LOC106083161 [Stomoxys calcitrans]|uniref:uncharacterized protein LOC106083161 n=1 Tax=Stomoxys calcitrans TaxID=35570 RepID=UPI0027E35301|nr:uncharacterized protein LOC106083161 [Stomoxys calcitrans]
MEEQYKQLNKELIEQVQEMRLTLKDYRDELVLSRSKWLEYQTKYNNLIIKCSAMAKAHFKGFLELVDPKSSYLSYLNGEMPKERSSSRRSSRMAEELRRTSSIVQTRRSFNSVSPISLTSRDEEDEAENGNDSRQTRSGDSVIREEDEDNEDNEDLSTIPRSSIPTRVSINATVGECSMEIEDVEPTGLSESRQIESDEGETIADDESLLIENSETNDSSDNNEMASEPSTKSTLRDVTNVINSPAKDVIKASYSKNTAKRGSNRKNYVTLSRGGRGPERKKSDNIDIRPSNASSMEEPRQSPHIQRRIESSYRVMHHEVRLPIQSLSDISIESFQVENSSTPVVRGRSRSRSPAASDKSTSSRPRRGCTPSSFAEKTLNAKLRNETDEKSLVKKGKISKKKKK